MRTLKVGQFDAVITIFNAIGHLTKKDFSKALNNIHSNLKNDGIYIFDILNAQALTESTIPDLACCIHQKVDTSQILSTQCSTFNNKTNLLTSYDTYLIQHKSEKPRYYYNTFSLQLYTAQELKKILAKNGFDVINQYEFDGKPFLEDRSVSIVTVAKKRALIKNTENRKYS